MSVTQNHVTLMGDYKFETILNRIKFPKDPQSFAELREAFCSGNKVIYERLKSQLPAFIVSGTFRYSIRKEGITQYSNLIVLDFDNIPAALIRSIQENLRENAFVRASFMSPSGLGIKIIVKVNTPLEYHEMAYKQAGRYFENLIGFPLDEQCKNLNRLCYFSHDPELYRNPNSDVFLVDLTWMAKQTSLLFETAT